MHANAIPANTNLRFTSVPVSRPVRWITSKFDYPVRGADAMEVRIGLDLHRGSALVHNGPPPVTGNRHVDGCSLGVIGGQRRLVHNLVAVDHGLCSRTRTGEVAVVPLDENTWITRNLVGSNIAFGNFP